MFPLMIPLIGAVGGALLNKRDPLKGALIGAGLGAGGAMLAPGLLGAAGTGAATAGTGAAAAEGMAGTAGLLGNAGTAATYGTGLGTQQTAMLAAQEAGMNTMPGLLGQADKLIKPIGTAMNAAQAAAPQQENNLPAPPMLTPPTSSPNLAQIAQNDAGLMERIQDEEVKRRNRQLGLIGRIGGY